MPEFRNETRNDFRGDPRSESRRSSFADDLSRLLNDAAGVAGGVRREAETMVRSQLDRLLSTMDVVTRDEFEAVREMAAKAREQNEALARRISDLETKLAGAGRPQDPATKI